MTIATTDQKARMFDLTTAISELFRDGNRDAEPVLDVLQFMKNERDGAERLIAGLRRASEQEPTTPTIELVSRAPKPAIVAYPAVGEAFELTLDGDALENQPLEMVRRDGYIGNWTHRGPLVNGAETRRFKLVSVGYCANWNELTQRKLAKHGEISPGQWREAFKKKYPTPDDNGLIGFPDASWAGPGGGARFPCVHAGGGSDFRWAGRGFSGRWRWFVGVRK